MNHPMIAVLNDTSLNLRGEREPEIYGRDPLSDVDALNGATARDVGYAAHFRQQGNHRDALVDAIRNASAMARCPVFEMHLSNSYRGEPRRNHFYDSSVVDTAIKGSGTEGGAHAILHMLGSAKADRL